MERRYWYQKQLRILQTVLREPDLQKYDVEKVVGYMKKTNTNCIVVNAGGIIDFFPNAAELGRENRFMDGQDMLKDLTEACHRNGIRVMVRVDFRGVEKERYEERPDWFAEDKDGGPVVDWGFLYKPCYNSYYANEHAEEFITRMMENYAIDGVWENSVGFGTGPCYCRRCRDLYRRETGREIPTEEDYRSEAFADYREWKARCADRHLARLRTAVKRFGEEKAFCAEIFGMFHASNAWRTGIDLYNAKDQFDFLVSPAFLDGAAAETKKWDNLSYASSSIRFLKSISPEKEAVLLCGNNGTKWRYIKAPEKETKLWMWEAAAVGGGFWNCMFNGQCPSETLDRRNAFLETEVYEYLKEHEKQLEGQLPAAEVGIYYSKPSRDFFGNDREENDGYGVFIKGVEQVLTERHIPWQFVPDLTFCLENIRKLKVLVLPNAACISEEHLEIIRRYVEQGGGIVASYETSLYDERGNRRQDFGLKDLFGCSYTGIKEDTSFDCYQLIRAEHPVLDQMGCEETQVLMNEGSTLLCRLSEEQKTEMLCSYIPRIDNQPPEFAWRGTLRTEYPTVTAGRYGLGKVVYFANQTDKLCYTNGHEDFRNLFGNAVEWVKSGEIQFRAKAPGSVHITWMQKEGNPEESVLSFVNTTAGSNRPIQEIIPVKNIEVTLRSVGKLKAYEIWKGGEGIKVTQNDREDTVTVCIDTLQEFAALRMVTETF